MLITTSAPDNATKSNEPQVRFRVKGLGYRFLLQGYRA